MCVCKVHMQAYVYILYMVFLVCGKEKGEQTQFWLAKYGHKSHTKHRQLFRVVHTPVHLQYAEKNANRFKLNQYFYVQIHLAMALTYTWMTKPNFHLFYLKIKMGFFHSFFNQPWNAANWPQILRSFLTKYFFICPSWLTIFAARYRNESHLFWLSN